MAIVKTSDQRDAWLSSIDEDTYNKITHDVQTGATFPIEGIPVTGHGNYNDFNEQRTKTLHFDSHTSSDFQSYKELRLITNDIAYASYDKCIQVYAKQHIGFTAYPVKETRDFVFIDYHYEPPHEDNPPAIELTGDITNGTVVTGSPPTGKLFKSGFKIKPNADGQLMIKRDGTKTMTLSIVAGGYGGYPFESTWVDTSTYASVSATWHGRIEKSAGTFTSETLSYTIDMNGKSCDQRSRASEPLFCDGNGKYAADFRRLDLTAAANKLGDGYWRQDTAKIICLDAGSGGCGYVDTPTPLTMYKFTDRPDLGQSLFAIVRSWSRPVKWRLTAEYFQYLPSDSTTVGYVASVPPGGAVTIRVPASAVAPLILFKQGTQNLVFTPGDSAVGFKFTKLTNSADNYYTYTFMPTK